MEKKERVSKVKGVDGGIDEEEGHWGVSRKRGGGWEEEEVEKDDETG